MVPRVILKFSFVAFFALVLLGSTTATADDLFPPPWRGAPGTTYAEWQFFGPGSDPFDPIIPDDYYNPNGQPAAFVTPGPGMEWQEEWGGRIGVYPLSGEIRIEMPNYLTPNPLKEIWVQITWAEQEPGAIPNVWADAPGYIVHDAEVINQFVLGPALPEGDLWIHTTYGIIIEPNPDFETIYISGMINVDQVVVDTWCVPEPATLSLIGLGGLVLMVFRRKK